MATSKFIIIRRDLEVDPTTVESDGITFGRLLSSDVTLNHPSVSRTHAGIRKIGGDYWVTNLSTSNGTILNGAVVDNAPLAAGDILQIGPFSIHAAFPENVLELTIDLSVNPLRAENAGTGLLVSMPPPGAAAPATDATHAAQAAKATPGGTRRLSAATGMLTGMLAKPEEFALKVFWDKRKRDAGKMAERTPLKPNLMRGRVGKARFNWRSTSDLRRPWATSLFVWGALIVTVVSVATAFALTDVYSPGPLSSPHVRDALALSDPALAVATRPNGNSCTTCHALTGTMDSRCAACHTTPAFTSTASAEHEAFGVACADCHGNEHRGDAFAQTAAKDSCMTCHRAGYSYTNAKLGKLAVLDVPHGGSQIGYPVADGTWTWKGWSEEKWKARELPKTASAYDAKGQFHILHVANGGPDQRVECSDCHTKGFDGASLRQGVRESCAACHNPNPTQTAAGTPMASVTQCTSCHSQHGSARDSLAIRRSRQLQAGKSN